MDRLKAIIRLCSFLCLFLTPSLHAQSTIKKVQVGDSIVFASADRPGELYIQTKGGQLQKFDIDGKLVNRLAPKPSPTCFEPRDGSRLFAYYRSSQQYHMLSPSFETVSAHPIDSAWATDPWLVCSSGDHNVWILDAADWSLKKINTSNGTVSAEVMLPATATHVKENYIHLREYQGFVFLLDRTTGILIFSAMGNLVKTISGEQIPYFNFMGEDLYYPQNNTLKFLNLFSAESREIKQTQASAITVLTDERIYRITGKQITIQPATP